MNSVRLWSGRALQGRALQGRALRGRACEVAPARSAASSKAARSVAIPEPKNSDRSLRVIALAGSLWGLGGLGNLGDLGELQGALGGVSVVGRAEMAAPSRLRGRATGRTGACELLWGSPSRLQRGEGSVRSKPAHVRTGRRGYLLKCASVLLRSHSQNSLPFAERIARAWRHTLHKPTRARSSRSGSATCAAQLGVSDGSGSGQMRRKPTPMTVSSSRRTTAP